jgi:hypothetical protein
MKMKKKIAIFSDLTIAIVEFQLSENTRNFKQLQSQKFH